MSSIAGHLMRRGTEAAVGSFQGNAEQANPGLVALFVITVAVIGLIFWSVSTSSQIQ
jgi:hypothetical protein